MTQVLEKRVDSGSKIIKLPQSGFSLLSHLDNIEYVIEQLENYSKNNGSNLVIGFYYNTSAMGTREILHQTIPYEEAEERKRKTGGRFDYYTISELLDEKIAYETGKYEVRNRHFVCLNPAYPN